jgi:hypothetical protein
MSLRKKIKKHLLKNGWVNLDQERRKAGWNISHTADRSWYHPTLGCRDFETAIIWQMIQEESYPENVPGWRTIQVPGY